jgi:hypothetical protein
LSSKPISDEEIQRRQELMKRILKRRDKSLPLGMTTAELVRLARREGDKLYESES